MMLRVRRPSTPVPFYLYRRRDVSGVSGTGVVAVGVVLPSGKAVIEWCSRWPTVTLFHSVDQILRIHGHGGDTEVRWGPIPEGGPTETLALDPPVERPGGRFSLAFPRIQIFQKDDDRPRWRPWWSRRPLEVQSKKRSSLFGEAAPWRRRG